MICKNCGRKIYITSDYRGDGYYHSDTGIIRCDNEYSHNILYIEVTAQKAEPFDEKDYFNNLIDTYYEIQGRG